MRQIILVCDSCGNQSEDIEPFGFIINGVKYNPDWCKTDREKFEKVVGKFIDSVPASAAQLVGIAKAKSLTNSETTEWNHRVRDWAKKAGHKVNAVGRIPEDIVTAYETMNPEDKKPQAHS